MMEHYTVRLSERQADAVENMANNGDADNTSEAIRDAIEHYAQALGYFNGRKRDTTLRRGIRRAADAFALAALIWVGFTIMYPVSYRLAALPMFAVAVVFYGADRALAAYEPRVSRWLARGESA